MRIFKALAATAFALVAFCGTSHATIIAVEYTGTYTASWQGNYPPYNASPGGLGPPYSGSLGSGLFTLTFSFNTSLALPGHFAPDYLDNFASGIITTPS